MKTTPSKFKPFVIVTKDNNKTIITAGTYQVSPIEFEDERQAEKYIREQPFEIMLNLLAIIEYAKKQEKQNEKIVAKDAKESV